MFSLAETRFWMLLTGVALAGLSAQCGGPESFRAHMGAGGHGGSSSAGLAGVGAPGTGGDGSAAGAGGTPPSIVGTAGSSGATGTGNAGTAGGQAGGGVAGGAGGTGGTGMTTGLAGAPGTAGVRGAAGAAGAGAAGTPGTAGSKGTAGAGGTAGAAGGGGPPDAGADVAPPSGMLRVQYQCRQNGPSVTTASYSINVVNTGTTDIPLNAVSVRYWYTIDGTGAQAGVCSSAAHPCTIAFQGVTPGKPNADQVGVISFATGTLAKGAETGEIQIDLHGSTGMLNQTNDYSFANTGAVFTDEVHVTGYISGKLVWGTAP